MFFGTAIKRVIMGGWSATETSLKSLLAQTSAGSSQADALAIPSTVELISFTTTGAGAGVVLPAPTGINDTRAVVHAGATNAVLLYPAVGGKLNGLAANASISIAVGKSAICVAVNATDWVVIVSA